MSLDNHPGFDSVSLGTSTVGKLSGLFGLLAKYYKFYLDFLTLPLFFIGYCIPQGSLVYWITNSSLTVIQQLSLRHPAVRAKLGLPDQGAPTVAASSKEAVDPGILSVGSPTKQRKVSAQSLSPRELLALSVQLLAKGEKGRAIPLLRLVLDKDPDYIRALIVMGQTLLQDGQLAEATGYLERAISKLFLAGDPATAEYVDLLVLSSQWAGVACIRQGKKQEGIAHLERVASLKEPDEPRSKVHYFDGLVLLASALYNEGQKTEASKYLRMAAAYNPAYNEYLEQCENDDSFVGDLASGRRRDY
ncbi:ALBINO3-like protein 2, chloroplastic [Morella rubra]|uniref:ALBINO3-like protein 2, chloroplastic n=1 Tax=Morella rubra TaxID=262757 RepID=A0A6A1UU84_9ROSI|nr:ALBINO3-like protein 2, chloroplastic [Morella rubra]